VCGISSFNGSPIDVTSIYNQFQTYLNEQIAAWNAIKQQQETNWKAQTDAQKTQWNAWFATINLDLQLYVTFNFDNLAALPGVEKTITFPSGRVSEEIIITGTSTKVATRTLNFTTWRETEVVYLDGAAISRSTNKDTTFPAGAIKEVVTANL
jgi:hypothetical protein